MKYILFTLLFFFELTLFAQDSCPKFHHWVRPHYRTDYFRYDGTYVSAADVSGSCRANQKSFQLWGKNFKNVPAIGWPHKEAVKAWSEFEIEMLLATIDKMPSFLSDIENVNLYRAKKSITPGNHATSAKNVIYFYDSAMKDEKLLFRVLAHELAHQYFFSKSKNIEKASMAMSLGWRLVNDNWTKTDKLIMLMEDSDISLEESFANAIEVFLTEPTRLKTKAPQVYDWIKIDYGDKIK